MWQFLLNVALTGIVFGIVVMAIASWFELFWPKPLS